MNPLTKQSWSPYLVGAGIGVLSWLAFATADRPIGITTAFEYRALLWRVCGRIHHDAGRTHCPRMHERPRDQWRIAVRAFQLDVRPAHFRRWDRNGFPHLRKGGPQPCLMNRSSSYSVS